MREIRLSLLAPLAFSLLGLAGCFSAKAPPSISLSEVNFAEAPVIIQRGKHYYLRYRCVLDDENLGLRPLLGVRATDDAGYYYFFGPLSSYREYGDLIERPLAMDGLEELASRGKVFWLDVDGTTHPIPMRTEE